MVRRVFLVFSVLLVASFVERPVAATAPDAIEVSPPFEAEGFGLQTNDVKVSADGHVLAYTRPFLSEDGQLQGRHLFVVDRRTGDTRQLSGNTDTHESVRYFDLSDDGSVIAWALATRTVWAWSHLDGAKTVTRWPFPRGKTEGVSVSGDGRYVAFGTTAGLIETGGTYLGDRMNIFRVEWRTGDYVSYPVPHRRDVRWPRLNDDGSEIVVAANETTPDEGGYLPATIEHHDFQTGVTTTLAGPGRLELIGPKRLDRQVFVRSWKPLLTDPIVGSALYAIKTSTGEITLISDNVDPAIALSEDGRYLAFGHDTGGVRIGRERETRIRDLLLDTEFVIPVSYRDQRRLDATGFDFAVEPVQFSPSSNEIVLDFRLCHALHCGGHEAFLVRVNLPPLVRLEHGSADRPLHDQIFRLYLAVFGRSPEQVGLDYWTGQRAAGLSIQEIASRFTNTAEFAERFGPSPTDERLVEAAYQNVLGRDPDPAGQAFWLARLANGLSVSSLFLAFADSDEHIKDTATSGPQTSSEGRIVRLYQASLGRYPDERGFSYWHARRQAGLSYTDMAAIFLSSGEFRSAFGVGLSDEDLVREMYRNVLAREPDDDGLSHWLGQLSGGLPPSHLLLAFANSTENIVRTSTTP